jgi:type II secretory pathway pseudopilin PulG
LLVVIVIVAVLATISLTIVRSMRNRANDSLAVMNMRQIGLGIAGFMSDNQRLPRFSGTGVSSALSTADTLTHAYVLQPYLGLEEPSSKIQYVELFKPPGLKRDQMNGKANWYELRCYGMYHTNDIYKTKAYLPKGTLSDSAGIDVGPFGRNGTGGNPTSDGWKTAILDRALQKFATDNGGKAPDLSMVPAMMELYASQKKWPWAVPSTPVRGDHVNVLYFDWHVGSVSPDYFFKP